MFKRASHAGDIPDNDRPSGVPSPWHAGEAAREWAQVSLAVIAIAVMFIAFWYAIN
jgi:hypothetical protein